jgi:hypothetical protein
VVTDTCKQQQGSNDCHLSQKQVYLLALVAGVISVLVFLPVLFNDFVNFDDTKFILNNTDITHLGWNLLVTAFTRQFADDYWMPLTCISFAIDYRLWGLNPVGYHLTSIVLHGINTGLVVLIADMLCKNGQRLSFSSAGKAKYLYPVAILSAGLLWSLHPLRAEAVAWATSRKDLLNGVFAFSSILFYLKYVHCKDGEERGTGYKRYYLLSLLLLMLSLMAKPVSVVIPALLMVIDWYPLERLRRDTAGRLLLEKVPYLAFVAAVFLISAHFTVFKEDILSFTQKLLISGNAIFEYCRLFLYPVGIIPVLIVPDPIPLAYTVKTFAAAIGCIFLVVYRRFKLFTASWLWFVLAISPTLAFVWYGPTAINTRFTYIPMLAPSIAAAFLFISAYDWLASWQKRYAMMFAALLIAVFVSLVVVTERLGGVWKNSGTMWSRVIEFQPFDRAFFTRGLYYVDSANYKAAITDFTTCIEIASQQKMPEIYNFHAFRGEAYSLAGRYEEAVADFTVAIKMHPHQLYFYHRGMALQKMGRVQESEIDFARAAKARGQMSWLER